MRAKLKEIKEELWRRMHWSIPEQGSWLGQVIKGFFGYHAVPTNYAAAEDVAVAEALIAGARESRMIGQPIFNAQPQNHR